jgi:hypothetical protein
MLKRIAKRVGVVWMLAGAGLLSTPAPVPAVAGLCGFCHNDSYCPDPEFYGNWDYRCGVCGLGTYVGGCMEDAEQCDYYWPFMICYYQQRPPR